MSTFLAKRSLYALGSLLGATFLVFLLLRVLPGDVALYYLVGSEGEASKVRPEDVARVQALMGLDKPLVMQYLYWIKDAALGDLGESLWLNREVRNALTLALPITAQLTLGGVLIGVVLGIPLGIVSALNQDRPIDYLARVVSIAFLALPSFWLGLLVLLVGVNLFTWSPPVGGRFLLWSEPGQAFQQMIFPSLILGSHLMAIVARMTRSSMLEVLREDYIRTARAKGLQERTVIGVHAMKNAMIPVITIVFLSIGTLLAGTVVLETLFSMPGIGALLLQAINHRDLALAQGLILFMAVVFVAVNIMTDLTYAWLDPRIRLQ
ncbi:MAG: ABC transporter permease [Chloroflexi bacterium]|nr:ABC transporter permease [Chloroflexota bacterium]